MRAASRLRRSCPHTDTSTPTPPPGPGPEPDPLGTSVCRGAGTISWASEPSWTRQVSALSGSDGHSAKVEDWTSMTSMTNMSSRPFLSGVNGVDKTNNEPDLKYPQQSSSSLSGYFSACAYSPPNQYGVYGGPTANYMTPGQHWQPQSSSLNPSFSRSLVHPGSTAPLEAADFHNATSFKLSQREEDRKSQSLLNKHHHATHRLSTAS
ncbi:hypothetical protein PAMP_014559 [Pampus punctatissimus]